MRIGKICFLGGLLRPYRVAEVMDLNGPRGSLVGAQQCGERGLLLRRQLRPCPVGRICILADARPWPDSTNLFPVDNFFTGILAKCRISQGWVELVFEKANIHG